jgi:hypothetical protein
MIELSKGKYMNDQNIVSRISRVVFAFIQYQHSKITSKYAGMLS